MFIASADAAAREDDDFADLVLQASTGEALGVNARGLEVGARHRLGLGDADPQALFRVAVLALVFDRPQGGHKRSFWGLVRRRVTLRCPKRGIFVLSAPFGFRLGNDLRRCLPSGAILLFFGP